jgi:hypothetical protein
MRWIVDGSNVLGTLGWNRESSEAKERLAADCARFARHERRKVLLCFDGSAPSGFATRLGPLSIRFCDPRTADDVIVALTQDASDDWSVVSSDSGLANRVRRRSVEIVSAREFAARLARLVEVNDGGETGSVGSEDWERFFSDPKNRVF